MLDLPVVLIMLLSELCCRTARLHIMPIFVPNDYMLENHTDKGEEDWEIYAWCVRDAISKAGDFKKVEFYNFQDRRNFYHFMNLRLDEIVIGDRSFSYDSRHASDGYEKVV